MAIVGVLYCLHVRNPLRVSKELPFCSPSTVNGNPFRTHGAQMLDVIEARLDNRRRENAVKEPVDEAPAGFDRSKPVFPAALDAYNVR
mmetsp:Transcript_43999/g.98547  ORF Transcript_43999/g.98547 Transcript_43999/m.98547 type:complete len:88 (-) Transcript_43999:724-987(-)